MSNLTYDQLYDKLFRHTRILNFTKTSFYGVKCYCYIIIGNEVLYSRNQLQYLKYFYTKVLNMVTIEMQDFRHGISR